MQAKTCIARDCGKQFDSSIPETREGLRSFWQRYCPECRTKGNAGTPAIVEQKAVPVVAGVPQEFINLLIAVTSKGGVKGNPYCDSDVRNALQCLTRLRGRHDWLDGTVGLEYTGDKRSGE